MKSVRQRVNTVTNGVVPDHNISCPTVVSIDPASQMVQSPILGWTLEGHHNPLAVYYPLFTCRHACGSVLQIFQAFPFCICVLHMINLAKAWENGQERLLFTASSQPFQKCENSFTSQLVHTPSSYSCYLANSCTITLCWQQSSFAGQGHVLQIQERQTSIGTTIHQTSRKCSSSQAGTLRHSSSLLPI